MKWSDFNFHNSALQWRYLSSRRGVEIISAYRNDSSVWFFLFENFWKTADMLLFFNPLHDTLRCGFEHLYVWLFIRLHFVTIKRWVRRSLRDLFYFIWWNVKSNSMKKLLNNYDFSSNLLSFSLLFLSNLALGWMIIKIFVTWDENVNERRNDKCFYPNGKNEFFLFLLLCYSCWWRLKEILMAEFTAEKWRETRRFALSRKWFHGWLGFFINKEQEKWRRRQERTYGWWWMNF